MVVDRGKRRARVRLEAERILSEMGETSLSTLTYKISDNVRYDVNRQQVALFIRNHPRIIRVGNRNNQIYKCIQ
tara:strand:- start:1237 stop:1458 length:222 start_codon:yes stop_codon:yes gene_type:complete